MLQSFQTRVLYKEQDQEWDCTLQVTISSKVGVTGMCVPELFIAKTLPWKGTAFPYLCGWILLFHSNQKKLPGIKKYTTVQSPAAWTRHLCRIVSHSVMRRDYQKFPSREAQCSQNEGFPHSFYLWKLTQILHSKGGPSRRKY
jgi:hypothetical protein